MAKGRLKLCGESGISTFSNTGILQRHILYTYVYASPVGPVVLHGFGALLERFQEVPTCSLQVQSSLCYV